MAKTNYFSLHSEHDGLKLALMTVLPDNGAPKALIQLAHGMAEHKARYIPFMEFLADHGFGCIINDHRGHGESLKSMEDLGYFYKDGAAGLLNDLHQITLYFRAQFPGLKLFLFGHSMGSLAVRCYSQKYAQDIDGLIVCGSPGKNPAAGVGLMLLKMMMHRKGERYISPVFINMTTGSFAKRVPNADSANAWLSTDKDNVAAFESDPLCGFPFTLNGYCALLTLMQWTYNSKFRTCKPDLPIHFVSGEEDPCAPDKKGFDEAIENMRHAGYIHVTYRMYPNMRHEILNETDHQLVFNDLLEILNGWNRNSQET